jgi:isoquinoline 1-oxidoreductase beta subunit
MSEQTTVKTKRRWRISRRGFLIGAGATGAALLLGVQVGLPYGRLRLAEFLDQASPPVSLDVPPTTWFEITPDNQVRLYVPKIEMGQGIHTALGQIGAEELEIRWDQLQVVQASTARGINDGQGTGASNSVSSMYQPLREAAATLREMLRNEAAAQLGVAVPALTLSEGVFSAGGRQITFGDVVTAKQGAWEVPEEAPALKPRSSFKLIGQSQPRVDFTAKLTGKAIYGLDARVEGMRYGAVLRPPTLTATLRRAAPGTAGAQSGVEKVVIEDDFVGVVARSRREAAIALAYLDVEWDDDAPVQQADIDALVQVGEGNGVVIQKEGEAAAEMETGSKIVAEYRTPMAAHAHLEPQSALVEVLENGARAWVATQAPFVVRRELADLLDLDEEAVEIIPTYLGGGFGRRLNVEVAKEAARLAAAAGVPVHIAWTREEEFQNGYLRPPTHSVLSAVLRDGRIHAIEHHQSSGDVAFISLPGIAAAVLGADFGAWRGATIQYGIPHIRTTAWRAKLPIRTGWWRGLGLLPNIFAVESFIDEVAEAAGSDPLAFRLAHLPAGELGERFRRVVEAVAEQANWGGPLPAGRAQGLAVSMDVQTIVAQIAEVSVENGKIRVHKVDAVMDPGLVINPDGARAQTEGSIIMGLSSTFLEEIVVENGRLSADNFDRYPLLSITDAPQITVGLLESGDSPFGIGEPPLGPVAAAVANAVYALTGERLREMPLRL